MALVALFASACGDDNDGRYATPSAVPDGRQPGFFFPTAIDYARPEWYLNSASQSTLSAGNSATVKAEVGPGSTDLEGVGRIFAWMARKFRAESAGGATIGKTDVNTLIETRNLTGCHDWALLLSTVLRLYGFPAVMVDTAGIQWAADYRAGLTRSFSGHVFVEASVDGRWIAIDSTAGTYAADYDPLQPVLPFTNPVEGRGFYVLYKGIDPADYGVTNLQLLNRRMVEFSLAVDQIDLTPPAYDIRPLPRR